MRFETIHLERDLETCFEFRRDSYFLSFGTHEGFESDMATYIHRMEERIKYLPQGNCHLWDGDIIIGQTEMKCIDDPTVGYVSLLYIAPDYRRLGYGRFLHHRAVEVFTGVGKSRLLLSVSELNTSALAFYYKTGWKNLGPRPGKTGIILMSLDLQQ